jgi:deoxycytidine triphosphate deaminase
MDDANLLSKIQSSAMWIDPDAKASGVLLSDRIRLYVHEVGLIAPFQEENLAPASYDLTVGSDYWFYDPLTQNGKLKQLEKAGDILVIPKNSIVFVCSAERLNLPFYLTARFNLKLRFLHEGLLIGTGPQIDPGFVGRLSCPLHNISNDQICLVRGETFAVLEFYKTTPFAESEHLKSDQNIEDLRRRGESRDLKGVNGFPCITFPRRALNRSPIKGYLPGGKAVTSSVQSVVARVDDFEEDTEKKLDNFQHSLRNVNLIAYLTLTIVAISFFAYFIAAVNWQEGRLKGITSQIDSLQHQLDQSAYSNGSLFPSMEHYLSTVILWPKMMTMFYKSLVGAKLTAYL